MSTVSARSAGGPSVLLANCTVVDGRGDRGAQSIRDAGVLIDGERIAAVGDYRDVAAHSGLAVVNPVRVSSCAFPPRSREVRKSNVCPPKSTASCAGFRNAVRPGWDRVCGDSWPAASTCTPLRACQSLGVTYLLARA